MVAHRFAAELVEFAGRPELIILPPPCPIDVQPMDFGHADELMSRAEADARAFLDDREAGVARLRRPARVRGRAQEAV